MGLFSLLQYLNSSSKSMDKKLYTALWALCKRVPLLHLGGVAMWRPLRFLARALPLKGSSMTIEAAERIEADAIKQLDAELPKDVNSLRLAICKWLPRFESDLTGHARKADVLGANSSLLTQAVLLGARLSQACAALASPPAVAPSRYCAMSVCGSILSDVAPRHLRHATSPPPSRRIPPLLTPPHPFRPRPPSNKP